VPARHRRAIEEAARRMTLLARDAELSAVRIEMARRAGGLRPRELQRAVTGRARRGAVRPFQRESVGGMIERRADLGRRPALRAMATRALRLQRTVGTGHRRGGARGRRRGANSRRQHHERRQPPKRGGLVHRLPPVTVWQASHVEGTPRYETTPAPFVPRAAT